MKINTTTILGIIIIGLVFWITMQQGCIRSGNDEIIKSDTTEVVVDIPSDTGSILKPTPKIEYIEVEKLVPVESQVDNTLIEKYEKENDSLRKELYKKATTINTYEEVFEDDKVKIKARAVTQGTLDSLSIVQYEVKPRQVTVPQITNTILSKKAQFGLGVETALPTTPAGNFGLETKALLKDKKDRIYTVGYDIINTNVTVGVNILF